jgi:hypothetical protein
MTPLSGISIRTALSGRSQQQDRGTESRLHAASVGDPACGRRRHVDARRYALKNGVRLDRLLMLMLLHANRQDERAYTKNIRQWLEANGGRPRVARRAIADSGGPPLR